MGMNWNGTKFYRTPHHFSLNNTDLPPTLLLEWATPMYISHSKMGGHVQLHLVCIIPYGSAFLFLYHSLLTINFPHTKHSILLFTPISVVPSLVSTHFYICSLTFSHRPDEAASVWRLWKLVCNKLLDLLCFSMQELLKRLKLSFP